jgi:nitrate reductase beta subunit
MGMDGAMPDVRSLRIPLKYLANLLTAGEEAPIASGLERMLAMRAYMRAKTIEGVIDETIARKVGLTGAQIEEMYHVMAIANYEDRFVIPTAHREVSEDAYEMRGPAASRSATAARRVSGTGQPVRRREAEGAAKPRVEHA